jgi:hypothetical protein
MATATCCLIVLARLGAEEYGQDRGGAGNLMPGTTYSDVWMLQSENDVGSPVLAHHTATPSGLPSGCDVSWFPITVTPSSDTITAAPGTTSRFGGPIQAKVGPDVASGTDHCVCQNAVPSITLSSNQSFATDPALLAARALGPLIIPQGRQDKVTKYPVQTAETRVLEALVALVIAVVLVAIFASTASARPTAPPRPVITAHPAKVTHSKSARFVVTEKQKNTHLGCQLVKGSKVFDRFHPCTSPIAYRNLKPAGYTFMVFAYPNGQCNGSGPCNGSRNTSFSWTIQ